MRLEPTIHESFPMETRVQVDESIDKTCPTGTIVGVAFMRIFTSYIVLLDKPLESGGETFRAITVAGGSLKRIAES